MPLAPYACTPKHSRGRLYPEPASRYRSEYQRDRDRIMHTHAFRRLKGKTQVFIKSKNDHHRTRLTHTMEVAQVARTVAIALGLNPDLTEAIALAHDFGHPPFGHTGEDVLRDLMRPFGGFDHNAQTMRIITLLECHYAGFDGLNLTWETLEGIAKHNGPVADNAVPYALAAYNAQHDLHLHTYASLEAQAAALADDIAYNNHDIQDGLSAGFFTDAQVCAACPMIAAAYAHVDRAWPDLGLRAAMRRRFESLRVVFGWMVEDVIETTRTALDKGNIDSVGKVRTWQTALVQFSPKMSHAINHSIRPFLHKNMYNADPIVAERAYAERVIKALFARYMDDPSKLPLSFSGKTPQSEIARCVTDYIAGMTDDYAIKMYNACSQLP